MPKIGSYQFPDDLNYMSISLWYRAIDEQSYQIGITDLAQQRLGDIVAVYFPEVGSNIKKGQQLFSIESIQSELTLKAPLSIHVSAINNELNTEPEKLNEQPYEYWVLEVRFLDEDELMNLPSIEDILDEAMELVEDEMVLSDIDEDPYYESSDDEDYLFSYADEDYY